MTLYTEERDQKNVLRYKETFFQSSDPKQTLALSTPPPPPLAPTPASLDRNLECLSFDDLTRKDTEATLLGDPMGIRRSSVQKSCPSLYLGGISKVLVGNSITYALNLRPQSVLLNSWSHSPAQPDLLA